MGRENRPKFHFILYQFLWFDKGRVEFLSFCKGKIA